MASMSKTRDASMNTDTYTHTIPFFVASILISSRDLSSSWKKKWKDWGSSKQEEAAAQGRK
jgi:hypothetical protein